MADDFKETEVGGRYAKALFELSLEQGCLDAVRGDLASLKEYLSESADLRRALTSPAFGADEKYGVLKALGEKAGFNALTLKAFGVLSENRRAADLAAVITGFERLYDRHRDVVGADVVSAVKLSQKQLDEVSAALRQAIGRDAEISTTVDPSILGGLKVKVGSRLFDASLKTQLDSLKFALKRA
ncbi:MAG: F0F1 ATP synthase subunit delta [Asticcacaulis sp.]